MATWTNTTKNTATFTNTAKNTATFSNFKKTPYVFQLSIDGTYDLLIDDVYKFNITDTESTAWVSVPKS